MRTLRLALAQINATVGDLAGNGDKIIRCVEEARALGADLVAFPELAVTGYPPEDLLLKPGFIADNRRQLDRIVAATRGITAVVGFVDQEEDIYNAAAIVHDGQIRGIYHKIYLPNYGVFDEDRYFRSGERYPVYSIAGAQVGVNICEDIWYPGGPTIVQALTGAEVIVNINASPYHAGKRHWRDRMLSVRASDNTAIVAYVNMVGGQDELVFDGSSAVYDAGGERIAHGKVFEEDLIVVDLDVESVFRRRLHDPRRRKDKLELELDEPPIPVSPPDPARAERPPLPARNVPEPGRDEEVYRALVLGTRDYVRKNGFRQVVLGLSGGIDSSLVAAVAVDALGSENVIGVSMPSRYSSRGSLDDAAILAERLGIRRLVIPIEQAFTASLEMLSEAFAGTQPGLAEENLQARIRGNILMSLSNKFGWLVLTTGNKSELATGYSTLYGDMAGGFAVIKDVPKTLVYALCEWRNRQGEVPVIPEDVLIKPPSAELRPDQRDTDSLPPYEVLDPILKAYVEEDQGADQIVAALDVDPALVERVIRMVDRNEYKRRQAPPGIKITPRAFGRDRRLPITNRYRGS